MKKQSMLAVVLGAAVICAAPVSLQWSSAKTLSLALNAADARIGQPLTPGSVAGVHRRVERRAYRRGAVAAGAVAAGAYYYGGAPAGADVGGPAPVSEHEDVGAPAPASEPEPAFPAIAPYGAPAYGYGYGPYRAYGAPGYGYGYGPYRAYGAPGYGYGPYRAYGAPAYGYGAGPYPAYAGPGYGYGPGPYPDTVIVNPVTGRWCRTEPNGHQWCWTP